ncbi:hypothetical protein FQN52_006653 [Onygenales sp. PD_12]|nr:hypothetical protein FQN52_006653 [Onygenales sp. PD_12]
MAESTAEPTTQGEPVIEVNEATDTDSSYGDEFTSYTASLTSSVLNYRRENGRAYHAYRNGSYLLPNDEAESERLDMVHEMMLTILEKKLFLAPIESSPQRTSSLLQRQVIGNDLSPTQPSLVPPNAKFIVEDIEDEWTYPPDHFNFIHARYLAVSIRDYPKLLKQSFQAVKPGGWVEFHDWDTMVDSEDGTVKGSSLEKYYREVIESFDEAGYSTRPGPQLEQWFKDAGFVDVHTKKFKVPLGIWPKTKYYKTVGAWNLAQAESGLEASGLAVLTRSKGWSKEEVAVFAAKARSDTKNPAIHPVFHL